MSRNVQECLSPPSCMACALAFRALVRSTYMLCSTVPHDILKNVEKCLKYLQILKRRLASHPPTIDQSKTCFLHGVGQHTGADMRLRHPAAQIAWGTSFPISAAASIEETTQKIVECLGCNFSMEIQAYKPQLPMLERQPCCKLRRPTVTSNASFCRIRFGSWRLSIGDSPASCGILVSKHMAMFAASRGCTTHGDWPPHQGRSLAMRSCLRSAIQPHADLHG